MNFPFWVVTATQCNDCGGSQTVRIFQNNPTQDEKYSVGCGSTCETIKVTMIENEEENFDEIDT